MKAERNLPDTERAILTVLLNDSHAIIPVMEILPLPEAFNEPLHQAVYGAILALTKVNTVPNVHTVADRLQLPIVTLQGLAQGFNTKLSREVRYLADIVCKADKWRRIDLALAEAAQFAKERPASIEDFTFLAMGTLSGAVDGKADRDPAVPAVNERLDTEIDKLAALSEGALIGCDTGLAWLNDKSGGLCPSHVWIVSAPYKGRKTTFVRNLIIGACRKGASVDMFALEGDQEGTAAGLRAMLATDLLNTWGCTEDMKLSETFVRRGWKTQSQQDALSRARTEMDGWNLRIYDGRDGIGTADRICQKVKRDKFMFGLQVFVLDYVQLLGSGDLFERLEGSTHALQRLIVEEGVTGVLLAQLNEAAIMQSKEASEASYSPGIKGGGDPAAAADFLIRTQYDMNNSPDLLTVQLKLARHAQPGKIGYKLNRQSGRILDGEKTA